MEQERLFVTDGIITISTAKGLDCQAKFRASERSLVEYARLRGAICLFKGARLVLSDGEGFEKPQVDAYLMKMRKVRDFEVGYEKEGYEGGQGNGKGALFSNLAKQVDGKTLAVSRNSESGQVENGRRQVDGNQMLIDISAEDVGKGRRRTRKRARKICKKGQGDDLKKRGSRTRNSNPKQAISKMQVRASTQKRKHQMLSRLKIEKELKRKAKCKRTIKDLRAGEFDRVRREDPGDENHQRNINFELEFEAFYLVSPYSKNFFENEPVMLVDCLTEEKESLLIRNHKLDKHIQKMRNGNDRSCGSVLDIGDLLGDVMVASKMQGMDIGIWGLMLGQRCGCIVMLERSAELLSALYIYLFINI